jgi:hypothetical protein
MPTWEESEPEQPCYLLAGNSYHKLVLKASSLMMSLHGCGNRVWDELYALNVILGLS